MIINYNTFSPSKIANRRRLLFDFLAKREKTRGLPLEIGIELTNYCNLGCIMCPYAEMVAQKTRPQGKMEFSLFRKIIGEIAPFAELVYLHGLGEPLLHPGIFEYIKYGKAKGLSLGMSTNATLLNQNRTGRLLQSGLDYLILAIDGATKKTYEKIRRGADFDRVEANIKYFLEEKKNYPNPPFTVLQFISMEKNKNEANSFLKKWHGKGINVVRIKSKIALKDQEKNGTIENPGYCFHIFRQLNINWDGTVIPCCEDVHSRYPLGNVKNSSLRELWNNQKMQKLRKINFQGRRDDNAICKTCHYPQPTILQALGVMALDHLTIKKILPFFERL